PASPASPAQGAAEPAIQRKLGELVFAQGTVTVHRAGASPERADIGTVVRAYDVLVTGPGSRAEIDIASGAAGGATVKLAENTAFYFDTKELSDAQRKTVIQLLSGALAVKVDKLANGSFQVATDQAVLGVRGTVFIVDTVPDGSLLVSCETGAVAVRADGFTATAKPGAAVSKTEAGSLDTVAVDPASLGSYRGGWRADAYASFASRALSYTSSYAAALDSGRPAFDAALARLQAQKPALDAWRAAREAGKEPRFTDWIAEKKAVSAALLECLKALFSLERPYYRLVELKALHEGGSGVGALKDGRSSAAYFQGFEASTRSLALGMAKVREAMLLFSWVSAGSPLGDFFGSKAEGLGTGAIFAED
ncbi:MAG: FecR family protein, partial [Spirochaetes bacterium]|nr:FecR family protein [Spirochaetota bacterium]